MVKDHFREVFVLRRIESVKIREALRLRAMKISNVDISRSICCSRTTLVELFRKCDEKELDYEKAGGVSDSELEQLLYPQAGEPKVQIPDPDYAGVQEQLEKHPHLNLKFLWDEYSRKNPEGLGYSQFCERYRRWRQVQGKDLTLPIERKPGETMEVDWAGETPI